MLSSAAQNVAEEHDSDVGAKFASGPALHESFS